MARTFEEPHVTATTAQSPAVLNEPNIRMPGDTAGDANPSVGETPSPIEPDVQNAAPQAPRNFKELQTVLQQMDSNFIFPVGWASVGKTVAFYSMLWHLRTENSPGELHPFASKWQVVDKTSEILKEVSAMFQDAKLPRETAYVLDDPLQFKNTRQANYEFVPKKSNLPSLKMTFVDLSGENYVDFIASNSLPPGVDVFFKVGGLSLTFLLMTTTERAKEDDLLFSLFLDHIAQQDPTFRKARAIIILTKWDSYNGKETPESYIRRWMPQTYAKTRNPANAIMCFTVGQITKDADGETDWLKKFNPAPAESLFKWIYQSITHIDLDAKPWWQRFLKGI
jgi:hypothetical protein